MLDCEGGVFLFEREVFDRLLARAWDQEFWPRGREERGLDGDREGWEEVELLREWGVWMFGDGVRDCAVDGMEFEIDCDRDRDRARVYGSYTASRVD